MKKTLITFFAVLFCMTSSIGWSADFEKGLAAAERGDFITAFLEWAPLAEQGNSTVQYNFGLMYDKGEGITQDYKMAVYWYRRSAEQGYANAQSNLGVMYGNGNGVIQDNIYAHMWWNVSASTGNKNAVTNRDIVAKRMTMTDISTAQKLARECVEKKYKGC